MALKDWLFGSDALKKAGGDAPKNSPPSESAGLDMGKLAQDSADRAKAESSKPAKSKSPLSTTMSPAPPKKEKK